MRVVRVRFGVLRGLNHISVTKIIHVEAHQKFRGGSPTTECWLGMDINFSAVGSPSLPFTFSSLSLPPAMLCDEDPCAEPLTAFNSHIERGESSSGSPPATSREAVTAMGSLACIGRGRRRARHRFRTSCGRTYRVGLGASVNFLFLRHWEVLGEEDFIWNLINRRCANVNQSQQIIPLRNSE